MKPFQSELVEISIMLVVSDLERSERFYNRFLGYETIESMEGLRRLNRDGHYLYLITHSPPTSDKPAVTLAIMNPSAKTNVNLIFRVSDCRKVFSDLRKEGLVFLSEPQTPPWGGWRVFARDPNGYLIEFEQPD